MRILVTGVCGRRGSAAAEMALQQGDEVVGIDHAPWSHPTAMPAVTRFELGSYTDVDLLEHLLPGCNAIVHTAGPRYWTRPFPPPPIRNAR